MLSTLRTKFSLFLKDLSFKRVRHQFEMNLEYNTDIIKLKNQLKNRYNLSFAESHGKTYTTVS